MFALAILPHQQAAAVLFLYALLAVCFSTKRPCRSVKPTQFTHLDVDLRYCTLEELQYMKALLTESQHADRLVAVKRELTRRQKGIQ